MSVIDIRNKTVEELQKEQELAAAELTIQDADFVERTPEIIAAEICQIADQTRKMVLNSSIEIGKRLCEAKEMIPHGEWGNWLEHSVNFKQSTANNLMKIYTEYGDIQGQLWGASAKSQTFGNLTYSQAVALLAVPAEEREEFVEKNDVENMSTRELQEAIKARDEAIQDRDAADQAKQAAEEKLQKEKKAADERVRAAQRQAESVREELDKLKDEIKNSKDKKELEKLKTQLKDAKDKLNAYKEQKKAQAEEVGKVQKEQQEEIERLKAELSAMESKETVSEEAQKEIDMLRAQLKKAESLGVERLAADEDTARFKILFQTVQSNFSDLKDAVLSIRDEAAREKRLKAIKKLLEVLLEAMDE